MARKDFDLERDFGFTAAQGKMRLSDLPSMGIDPEQRCPALYARFLGLGWDRAKIGRMNLGPAYHNQAVLEGQGGGQPITGRVTSNNGVKWPAGTFDVNYPCIVDGGEYIGQGSGYAGTNPVSMNTTLKLNRADWLGDFDVMNLMQTSTWGMLSGSNSYTQSGTIDGFLFSGDNGGWYDSGYTSNGLGLWDIGENWKVKTVFTETFNGYGVCLVRGTPATLEYVSSFQNALGAIGIIGGDLSTYSFGVVSGDDNPAMFVIRPGYGRPGGARMAVDLVKSESGKRTPNKGQIIMDAQGFVQASFASVWMACDYEKPDAAFVIENVGHGSIVNVDVFNGYGYKTILQDITNKKRWANLGEYVPVSFTWTSVGGGQMRSLPDLTASSCNCVSRLGTSKYANGSWTPFDYANCTPAYQNSGTVTPPPVEPPPVDPGPVDPPTPTDPTVIASISPAGNTSAAASNAVDWKSVKRIRFTNVTFTDLNYKRFGFKDAADANGINLKPSGRFFDPAGKQCTQTAVIVAGTKYATMEVTLPTAVDIKYYLAKPGNGSALLYSADKVEVLNN